MSITDIFSEGPPTDHRQLLLARSSVMVPADTLPMKCRHAYSLVSVK